MTPSGQTQNVVSGWQHHFWQRNWLKVLLLLVAVLLAYQPVWHAGFIWDDDAHLTRPDLRTFGGLAGIWIRVGATQQYYPLVHSVFWVEHRLWGDWPPGYHLVNILLHAAVALLLVRILQRLKIPGGWLAGMLFAMHPVAVESVAWISELKNTLSGVFYLGAALAYLGFDQRRGRGSYALALVLFALGLMAKTVIATLPAGLLVIFWWQRGRLSLRRDVLPLVPFLVLGIGAGLFTAWVEWKYVIGVERGEFQFTMTERVLIACRAVWFYLGKLGWPADLIFIYPRWEVSAAVWWQYVYPAGLLVLLVVLWRLARWRRGPLAAMLFFVGTLFPALGFFDVYPFRFSYVADHFQYLASLGPLTLAAAGVAMIRGRTKGIICGMLLVVLGVLTWRQSGTYVNQETLWQTTIARNPDCPMAYNNLGMVRLESGQVAEAVACFRKVLAIQPQNVAASRNLAWILATCPVASLRNGTEAVELAEQAVRFSYTSDPVFMGTLAAAYAEAGRFSEAITTAQQAWQMAIARNRISLADVIKKQIELYQAGSPSRDPRLTNNLARFR